MDALFFDDFEKLGRIVISAALVYILIVLSTKVFGKRSVSQLNNFDWIVTVMIGSIGASTIILKGVPFIEGVASIITLYLLQFMVTKTASRSKRFRNFILTEPRIVFFQGEFLEQAMREERLYRQELVCAVREQGFNSLDEVEAIIFESDAKLTVMPKMKQEGDDEAGRMSETVAEIDSDTV